MRNKEEKLPASAILYFHLFYPYCLISLTYTEAFLLQLVGCFYCLCSKQIVLHSFSFKGSVSRCGHIDVAISFY